MQSLTIQTQDQAEKFAKVILETPKPFQISLREGANRSLQANALLHKWYGEIAKQRGELSAADVKGQCHVAYGVPIRLRDQVWARVWNTMFAPLTYEQQVFLFARGILSMTRDMSVSELNEYMNAMQADYRALGVHLTEPEE